MCQNCKVGAHPAETWLRVTLGPWLSVPSQLFGLIVAWGGSNVDPTAHCGRRVLITDPGPSERLLALICPPRKDSSPSKAHSAPRMWAHNVTVPLVWGEGERADGWMSLGAQEKSPAPQQGTRGCGSLPGVALVPLDSTHCRGSGDLLSPAQTWVQSPPSPWLSWVLPGGL